LTEPPDADPHVRWCGRKGASRPLLSRLRQLPYFWILNSVPHSSYWTFDKMFDIREFAK
jgi:hypothetical protein